MKLNEIFSEIESKYGDEGKNYINLIQKHITDINEEAKSRRITTSELKTELENKDYKYKSEIQMLSDKLSTLESNIAKVENEKINAEKLAAITAVVAEVGIKKNVNHHVEALKHMVIKGETGYLVGNKSLKDYCQELIDSAEPTLIGKTDIKTNGSNEDLYTLAELETCIDIKKLDQEKVNRSISYYYNN